MDDLRIPAGPGCPHGLLVPAGELAERFSHASGPGGQGVNTADSRVQLSLDLAATTALDDKQRERALSELGERLVGTVLTVTAAETRSQRRNRAAAPTRTKKNEAEVAYAPSVLQPINTQVTARG
ncbi:peptide chain release factor-like protein [uncultured Actinomyces sp.]|uniref:peptide chain release factor-like protein n=1 Tax=uncultured Actinomyces sp. TaxID=249061 RepID=UPI0028D5E6DA|nr:peptide chain release factor-like protein [uncultured Actinomyces sp.]